jgi:hypothetical protein
MIFILFRWFSCVGNSDNIAYSTLENPLPQAGQGLSQLVPQKMNQIVILRHDAKLLNLEREKMIGLHPFTGIEVKLF